MWSDGLVEPCGRRGEGPGRYLVSLVPLNPGQVVLREAPLVFGPKQSSPLVCVECCCLLSTLSQCPRCGLPLCGECGTGARVRHQDECELLVCNKIKFTFRGNGEAEKVCGMVTVLRLLLARGWEDLETHYDEREGSPIWLYNQKFVVPLLVGLRKGGEKGMVMFSEEDIHRAAGALDTNTFEVKQEGRMVGRALYLKGATFNNDCSSNCDRKFDPVTQEVSFQTVLPVPAGSQLTISYTGLLQPTHVRQAVFSQTKHFTCSCARCRDPTELGSHLSSLPCSDCRIPVARGDSGSEGDGGSCSSCGTVVTQDRFQQVEEMTRPLVSRLTRDTECQVWHSCLTKVRRLVTANHFLLVQLKQGFLGHAADCDNCKDGPEEWTCLSEVQTLRELLQPGVVASGEGEEPGLGKVMFGGDIVKQGIRSKLGERLERGNLQEETVRAITT